jgi:hypothetical protein
MNWFLGRFCRMIDCRKILPGKCCRELVRHSFFTTVRNQKFGELAYAVKAARGILGIPGDPCVVLCKPEMVKTRSISNVL